jgi:hypothetical protein
VKIAKLASGKPESLALITNGNLFSFKDQGKYLMTPKWMDFGGPDKGKGVNTVVIAGHAIRKNQLGNIELIFVSTLDPQFSKTLDATIGYNVGAHGTYDPKHPYAGNFGIYAGQPRADNLAAFGVGHGIARELERIVGWKKGENLTVEQIEAVTVAQMKTAIEDAFQKDHLDRWVNEFHKLYGGRRKGAIEPDALYFIPEYGGFNTDSLLQTGKGPSKPLPTSIEVFEQLRKEAKLPKGAELDTWLRENRENYVDALGRPPTK